MTPLLIPYPQIDPVLVQLGPFPIRWYALAYIAGLIIGWRYAIWIARQLPSLVPAEAVDEFLTWATLGVVIGGRLGHVLFYQPSYYLANPSEIVMVWHGGMSFHGGALGVIAAIVLFALKKHVDIRALGDIVCAAVPIGLFFGRIANFINGELWGRHTDLPWGMVFCSPHIRLANGGQCPAGLEPRHPSQLYEAALEGVLIFLVLRLATHRLHWLQRRGAITGMFLVLYGLIRILLETVRNPDLTMPVFPLGLTMGMMLSAPMVLAGVVLLWWSLTRGPAPEQPQHEPA